MKIILTFLPLVFDDLPKESKDNNLIYYIVAAIVFLLIASFVIIRGIKKGKNVKK